MQVVGRLGVGDIATPVQQVLAMGYDERQQPNSSGALVAVIGVGLVLGILGIVVVAGAALFWVRSSAQQAQVVAMEQQATVATRLTFFISARLPWPNPNQSSSLPSRSIDHQGGCAETREALPVKSIWAAQQALRSVPLASQQASMILEESERLYRRSPRC